ncbi:TULIP family P47-like protein [Paenibacillus sp. N3.4]|uniref:TULIP family P47-like protein n=1 Tax=Paenibacillus sp. N3.4 TaxID=2603222 RepID=UPI0011C7A913|nr:TULIP family P47-like protein [Paenibacillus sp. N3.4]TXK79845.1 hypothetical protein FU659_19360 [Paenibacillus sp. N3.4]
MVNTTVLSSRSMPISFTLPHLNEKLRIEQGINDVSMLLSSDKSVSTVVADTLGWDTVYAIRVPDINNAIVAKKASPKTFTQTTTDPDLGIEVSIDGEFGDWAISRGGDGQNLHMKIPITKGTYTTPNKTYSLNNCNAVINIKLAYFPNQIPQSVSEVGSKHDLKLKTDHTDEEPIVFLVSFLFPHGADKPASDALLQGAFRDWFNANIKKFEHIFSTVNINLHTEDIKWLKPTYTSYAYSDNPDPDESFFAVLCMTDGRSGKGLTHALSPSAIAPDSRASFLISRSLFLEKSMLPGVPTVFVDSSVDNFQLINGKTEISNKDGVILKIKPIKYGAIYYTPYAESFNISVNEHEIITKIKARIVFSPGIEAVVSTTTYQTIELVNKPDGTQTIGFKASRPTESMHTIETATWVIVTTVIVGLIATVYASLVGYVVGDLTIKLIVCTIAIFVGVLITLLLSVVLQTIAKGVAESMPSINPVIQAATGPIVWPTAKTEFKLTSAQLNGALQFGGDPGFAL